MPRITVRKCPFTKALFESDSAYAEHLCKLRKEMTARRRHYILLRNRAAVFTRMRETCRTAADIEQFIMKNWKSFVANGISNYPFSLKKRKVKSPSLLSIKLSFKWGSHAYGWHSGLISNTHAAPITGPWAHKTNWGGMESDKGVPRGYPGWSGEITFSTDGDFEGFTSDLFKGTGINTGSGGAGGKNYRYDLSLFADDWPAMLEEHERNLTRKVVFNETV